MWHAKEKEHVLADTLHDLQQHVKAHLNQSRAEHREWNTSFHFVQASLSQDHGQMMKLENAYENLQRFVVKQADHARKQHNATEEQAAALHSLQDYIRNVTSNAEYTLHNQQVATANLNTSVIAATSQLRNFRASVSAWRPKRKAAGLLKWVAENRQF